LETACINQIYSALSASGVLHTGEMEGSEGVSKIQLRDNEEKPAKSDDNLANAAKPVSAEKSQTCPH
jgi:hypothetical protein